MQALHTFSRVSPPAEPVTRGPSAPRFPVQRAKARGHDRGAPGTRVQSGGWHREPSGRLGKAWPSPWSSVRLGVAPPAPAPRRRGRDGRVPTWPPSLLPHAGHRQLGVDVASPAPALRSLTVDTGPSRAVAPLGHGMQAGVAACPSPPTLALSAVVTAWRGVHYFILIEWPPRYAPAHLRLRVGDRCGPHSSVPEATSPCPGREARSL